MKTKTNMSRKGIKRIREVRKDFPIIPHGARQLIKKGVQIRPVLKISWDNEDSKLVAIGINPSKATDNQTDVTVTKLCRLVDTYGFNNVTLLNLYNSVSPHQNEIDRKTYTDLSKYKIEFDEANIILLIWGRTRKYKERMLEAKEVLASYRNKVYCIGMRDMENKGYRYPLHPSRMSYSAEIIRYNIDEIGR